MRILRLMGASVLLAVLSAGVSAATVGKLSQYKVNPTVGEKIGSLALIFVNPVVTADSDPSRAQGYALSGVQDPVKMARAADRYAELFTLNGVPTTFVGAFDKTGELKTVLSQSLSKSTHVLFFEPVGAVLTTMSTRAQPIGSVRYRITLLDSQSRRLIEMYDEFGVNFVRSLFSPDTLLFDVAASRWYNTLAAEKLVDALPEDPKRPPSKTYPPEGQDSK